MERNTRTTIDQLKTGDRFYLASDKKRDVWTKLEAFNNHSSWANTDEFPRKTSFRHNTQVVFLRHAE